MSFYLFFPPHHTHPFLRQETRENTKLFRAQELLKLFSILIFARNCWQLKSYHMSEYQLPRLFDDFGQAWIRISCNFSSSSGVVLPLSLSKCTLRMKKKKKLSKVTGYKLLLLLCQMKLSFCYMLQFWHLLASRERFAVRRGMRC